MSSVTEVAAIASTGGAVGAGLASAYRWVGARRRAPAIDERTRAEARLANAQAGSTPLTDAENAIRATAEALRAIMVAMPQQIAAANERAVALEAEIEQLRGELHRSEEECAKRIARLYQIIEERANRRTGGSPSKQGGRRRSDPGRG